MSVSLVSTLIIADDHPLFRSALRNAVAQLLPGVQIVEADTPQALNQVVQEHPRADLILLDLRMPGVQGFSALITLRGQYPAIPVLVVSAVEDPAVMRRALDFGACGFIPKSVGIDTIGEALHAVLEGGVWLPPGVPETTADSDSGERELAQRVASLTPQQFRVLMMLADGRLNKQIAGDLNVSEATIKAHVTAILRKLGLYRRTQAAVLAQRLLRAEAGTLAPPPAADTDEESD
ncbi:MAG: response regulator transcription factor [Nevskia sp.]|nr:response regulator transcription factor [Nevskia sp.]